MAGIFFYLSPVAASIRWRLLGIQSREKCQPVSRHARLWVSFRPCKNASSCDTTSIAPGNAASALSIACVDAKSRWLVGSSNKSSWAGSRRQSTHARAAFRRSPPLSADSGRVTLSAPSWSCARRVRRRPSSRGGIFQAQVRHYRQG